MYFSCLLLILLCDSLSAVEHCENMAATSGSANLPPTEHRTVMCGGVGGLRPVNQEDLKIWNLYKEHLESKIQKQFDVPQTHKLTPVQVATQVVAGQNYFFKVELPNKKYATARVYHIDWRKDTHGKESQVAIHAKLLDKVDEDVGHF